MYTDTEMSFFIERIYAIVHFKAGQKILFNHSERTPLLLMVGAEGRPRESVVFTESFFFFFFFSFPQKVMVFDSM